MATTGIVLAAVILLIFLALVAAYALGVIGGRPTVAGRPAAELPGSEGMERKAWLAVLLMAASALLIIVYVAIEPNRQEAGKVRQHEFALERAIRTYTVLAGCHVCHGFSGEGAVVAGSDPPRPAPALNRADFRPTDEQETKRVANVIRTTIARGRPGTPMPPWSNREGGAMVDEEIEELVALIMERDTSKSWAKTRTELVAHNAPTPIALPTVVGPPPDAGPAQRGQAFFVGRGGCGACHIVSGVSGAVGTTGPNLSAIATAAGTRRPGMGAEAYIRESIQTPTAFVAPGFQPIMPPGLASGADLEDVVAFLLTRQ